MSSGSHTPTHADFPPCPLGHNATFPTGVCRICEMQNKLIPLIEEHEGEEAAVAFIKREQPEPKSHRRTA